MTQSAPETDVEWIFGYGSLMWRPGFAFREQRPARLTGYHRALCVYSHRHRGTEQRPGLVLGLDRGGECTGIAFKIDIKDRPDVIEYLNERELIGYAYKAVVLPLDLGHETVPGFTYVADPAHPNYAGRLHPDRMADLIMQAQGESGLNRDYVISTVQKLTEQGIADAELTALLARIRRRTGVIDQGGGI